MITTVTRTYVLDRVCMFHLQASEKRERERERERERVLPILGQGESRSPESSIVHTTSYLSSGSQHGTAACS